MGNLLFFPPLTGPYIAQAVLELLRPPVLISETLRLWAYNTPPALGDLLSSVKNQDAVLPKKHSDLLYLCHQHIPPP